MNASELSPRPSLTMTNLSQHLAMMREHPILTSKKTGNVVYYRIANPRPA